MKRTHAPFFLRSALLLLLSSVVLNAHPGHEGDHDLTWSFTGGLSHPLGGLDHVLAMLAVGWGAVRMGGKARWLMPLTFLGMMALGAGINLGGGTLALLEQSLAASLLVLGLLLASKRQLPLEVGLILTAVFALFHGLAHGGEAPAQTSGWAYGAGFLITTGILHAAGMALGATRFSENKWVRHAAGGAVAATGAVLMLG